MSVLIAVIILFVFPLIVFLVLFCINVVMSFVFFLLPLYSSPQSEMLLPEGIWFDGHEDYSHAYIM